MKLIEKWHTLIAQSVTSVILATCKICIKRCDWSV